MKNLHLAGRGLTAKDCASVTCGRVRIRKNAMQPSGGCGEEVRCILVRAEMRPAVRSKYELLDTLPLQVLSFPNETQCLIDHHAPH